MKFYQLKPLERRRLLAKKGIYLNSISANVLKHLNNLSENVVGQLRLPLGIVQNLKVNDHSYLVPLAIEEPSVVAAANHGAKIFAENGGVQAESQRDGIYGQIVLRLDPSFSMVKLRKILPKLIKVGNQKFSSLVHHGGGIRTIRPHLKEGLLFLKVQVDPAEAMGANQTNLILEYLSQKLTALPGVKERIFAILSNYPSQPATARVKLRPETVGGLKVAQKIALLSQIAQTDVYRAVTNNKGIMNGIDGVLLATGNDFRAVEAASGVLAAKGQNYHSLSRWQLKNNFLEGQLSLPLAIGIVGGSINARADVQQSFQLLGAKISSAQLAEVVVSVGLANNLAAMLAIVTTGIQAGHMKLQVRNLVASLKASPSERQEVKKRLLNEKIYHKAAAEKILREIRKAGR